MDERLMYRIVRRLRAPGAPMSRNRHFPVFDAPEGRRALRVHRRIRSLETDLLALGDPGGVQVSPVDEDTVRLEVSNPRLRSRRTAYLRRGEVNILLESRAGALLRSASGIRPDWGFPGTP